MVFGTPQGAQTVSAPFHSYTKIARQHQDTTAQTIESTIGVNVNHLQGFIILHHLHSVVASRE